MVMERRSHGVKLMPCLHNAWGRRSAERDRWQSAPRSPRHDKRRLSFASGRVIVIRSFRHRGLERLYRTGDARYVAPSLRERVEVILSLLDVATSPRALDLPGLRLHPLRGPLTGQWAVSVNANWRIVFRFDHGDAFDVALVDYH